MNRFQVNCFIFLSTVSCQHVDCVPCPQWNKKSFLIIDDIFFCFFFLFFFSHAMISISKKKIEYVLYLLFKYMKMLTFKYLATHTANHCCRLLLPLLLLKKTKKKLIFFFFFYSTSFTSLKEEIKSQSHV